jgi:hypothetical protein
LDTFNRKKNRLEENLSHCQHPGQTDASKPAGFFSRRWQRFLPRADLIEQSRLAVDELIDVAGERRSKRCCSLSAEQVAGPSTPGQRCTGLLWRGQQASGCV